MTLTPQQRRERAKEDAEQRRQADKQEEAQRNHLTEAEKGEQEMNMNAMPPWALALYHQNKAIMAELGIE